MTRRVSVVSAILVFLTLTGCAPLPHDPKETYILVTSNTRIPYWQEALAGLNRAGSEMKVTVAMVGPNTYDPKAQREDLQTAIHDKPAGILISVADAALVTADIDSAVQQGIPVITIDSDAPASKRLFFIGSDNYRSGRLGGDLLVKLLGGQGNVVMFTYPRQNNLIERQHGYESAFADHPGIHVTQAVDVQGDPATAYKTAKQLLTAKAKVDAFVCLEAVAGPQVGDVLSENNATGKIAVMAMDTDQGTLKWIQQGVIAGTIAQKPYTMAYLGVKLLDDIHHHMPKSLTADFGQDSFSPLPSFVDTGTFVVDKQNVSKFMEQRR
ncbi:MAG: substrate-binding domain-containing protein [Bryobacteraceae bacterium]